MSRRKTIYLTAAGLLVAVLAAAGYLIANRQPSGLNVTLLFPQGPVDQMLWPNRHSWVWSIKGLDPEASGDRMWLAVRVVHKEGTHPVASFVPEKISKKESEREILTGKVGFSGSALVSIQIIDLRAAALSESKETRPLRLMLTVASGVVSTRVDGKDSVIEGEQVIGWSTNYDPKWTAGELHLQTIDVKDGDRTATYYFVVVQGGRRPP
jgi:hypothetical protein